MHFIYFSNANEKIVLIYASRHGPLVLIYQLYLVTLDSFYIDFGFAKLRFISCYASTFSTKIFRSYLAEISRGLYMPLFSVSLSANETILYVIKIICTAIFV